MLSLATAIVPTSPACSWPTSCRSGSPPAVIDTVYGHLAAIRAAGHRPARHRAEGRPHARAVRRRSSCSGGGRSTGPDRPPRPATCSRARSAARSDRRVGSGRRARRSRAMIARCPNRRPVRSASCPPSTTPPDRSGRAARTASCGSCAARTCGYWLHPPAPGLPARASATDLAPEAGVGPGDRAHLHDQPPAVVPGPRPALRRRHRRAARAGGPAADHQHRRLRARRRAHRHAGAGRRSSSTTTCGCRSSSPTARSRVSGVLERPGGRSPASASPQVGRRLYRDPLDLTVDACLRGHRRRRARPATTSTASPPTPATWTCRRASPASASPSCRTRCASNLNWFTGGLESPGQLGSVVNACAGGRHRAGQPRRCASARCGRPPPRATRAGRRSCRAAAAAAAGGRPHGRLHAVDAAVRRAVGRQLDRDDGPAPLPRVRHDPRAARRRSRSTPARNAGASTRRPSTATR